MVNDVIRDSILSLGRFKGGFFAHYNQLYSSHEPQNITLNNVLFEEFSDNNPHSHRNTGITRQKYNCMFALIRQIEQHNCVSIRNSSVMLFSRAKYQEST